MYNDTNITNANTLYEMVVGINDLSNHFFIIAFLFTMFLILMIAIRKTETDIIKNFTISCAVISVVSWLMWAAGLITMNILLFPNLGVMGGIIMIALNRRN